MSTSQNHELPDDDELLLMEYLDSELDVESRRRVEARLAGEPELRKKMSILEQSWRSLDLLEPVGSDRKLAETTIETVVFSAEQAITGTKRGKNRWFYWVGSVLLAFLSLGAGHFLAVAMIPNPNFQLVFDLPIIERFDRYQNLIDHPELLRLLVDQRVFVDPEQWSHPTPGKREEYLAAPTLPSRAEFKRRLESIRELDNVQYSQFRRNYDKFYALNEKEQKKFRQINSEIADSANPAQADATLTAYHLWFKTLPTYEKEQIFELGTAAERVEKIREIRQRNEEEADPAEWNGIEEDSPTTAELAAYLESLSPEEREHFLFQPPETAYQLLKVQYRNRRHP